MSSRTLDAVGRFGVPPRAVLGVMVTLALIAPAAVAAVWPEATELLAFDRSRMADGEWWRAVTGHWTHWSLDHLLWDLFAFVVLVPLCWRAGPALLGWTLGSSTMMISVALWFGAPAMLEYRGLSGLDSALFGLLAAAALKRAVAERDRGSVLLLGVPIAAFAAKTGFEWITGQAVFVGGSGFVPVPLAHGVGGACGVWFGWTGSRR
jgi:rhomboid family GlyGly-CTERM serine protease